MTQQVAIVVGVGPGLGLALVNRFADAGMKVAAAARNSKKLAASLGQRAAGQIRAYDCDTTEARDVETLFAGVERDLGRPDIVVYNAGAFQRAGILDIAAEDFVRCWRVGCYGGFLVGQQAARRMVPRGAGTIIFTGATASLRGGALF